jgi:hypothetical protein
VCILPQGILSKASACCNRCNPAQSDLPDVETSGELTGTEYRVIWSALFQAAADMLHLDDEPAIAEALLEFPIIPGGPYGQDSAGLESVANGG